MTKKEKMIILDKLLARIQINYFKHSEKMMKLHTKKGNENLAKKCCRDLYAQLVDAYLNGTKITVRDFHFNARCVSYSRESMIITSCAYFAASIEPLAPYFNVLSRNVWRDMTPIQNYLDSHH